ncbi:MAG: hypothetical protein M9962_00735 [Oligoflexia bacterium]|nr:hypothetical protein [Oligoflexia bacterium]
MKYIILSFIFFSTSAFAKTTDCKCTCVTKSADGKYQTESGSGKTREIAGEKLKKALGDRKCEIPHLVKVSVLWIKYVL